MILLGYLERIGLTIKNQIMARNIPITMRFELFMADLCMRRATRIYVTAWLRSGGFK